MVQLDVKKNWFSITDIIVGAGERMRATLHLTELVLQLDLEYSACFIFFRV